MKLKVFYALSLLLSLGLFVAGMVLMIPNAPDPHTLTGNWLFVGGGILAMTGALFLFLIGVVVATLAGGKAEATAPARAAH